MGHEAVQRALEHADKLGFGAAKRKKLDKSDTGEAVMKEFDRGTLYSGGGGKVTSLEQAKAIAHSEASKKRK